MTDQADRTLPSGNASNTERASVTGIEVDGTRIAVRHTPAASRDAPGIAWLGGWRSDMQGSKALALDALARSRGWACLRHDYSGHGESGGDITHGTISRWTKESLAVLDAFADGGRFLLCGSSMGAWIALRMVAALEERGRLDQVIGLLLIAPAPDFVTELMEPRMGEAERRAIAETGRWEEPSDYSDEPNVWTAEFLDDGRRAAVLTGPLHLGVPVHVVQGTADAEVPVSHAEKLLSHLPADEATITLVRDGDHRLSRDEDLVLLRRLATGMVEAGATGARGA